MCLVCIGIGAKLVLLIIGGFGLLLFSVLFVLRFCFVGGFNALVFIVCDLRFACLCSFAGG